MIARQGRGLRAPWPRRPAPPGERAPASQQQPWPWIGTMPRAAARADDDARCPMQAAEHGLDTQSVPEETTARAVARLAVAQQVCAPDLTATPEGTPTLRQGVAAERRMSVEDAEMRHGRKSRSLLVDGDKRHVA